MNFMPSRKLMYRRGYMLSSTMSKFDLDLRETFVTATTNVYLRFTHFATRQTFTITPSTHYQVVSGLKKAIQWFYDEDKPDLFVLNEKDQLVFNNDYNELSVLMHSPQIYNEHMEIRPCVNNSFTDRGHEGVIIFINASDAAVVINREELEEIYTVLNNFSYQTEIDLLIKIEALATQVRIHQPM